MNDGINILDLVNDSQGSGPLQSFPVKPHIQVKDKPHIQVEKRKRCSICFSSNHDHWSCEQPKRAPVYLSDYHRPSVSRDGLLLPITIRKSIISFLWPINPLKHRESSGSCRYTMLEMRYLVMSLSCRAGPTCQF